MAGDVLLLAATLMFGSRFAAQLHLVVRVGSFLGDVGTSALPGCVLALKSSCAFQ